LQPTAWCCQFDQIGAIAHQLHLALRFKPLAQGHRIERAIAFGQLADRAVDHLVIAAVEVGFGQLVVDPVIALRGQHQPAQHRLFGLDRMRRHAQGVDAHLIAIKAVTAVFAVGTEAGAGGHEGVYFLQSGARDMVGTERPPQPCTTLWINSG
jgi:hypothetical protein